MNPRIMALVVGAALAAGWPAAAQDARSGFYLGARAIGSVASMDDVDATGFVGSHLVENDDDLVAGVGGVVGYVFKRIPLRTEIEGAYRFRFDLDNRDIRPGAIVDYESNVATTSVLFNAVLEWRNKSPFTPYIGGTIGWARNDTETDRTVLGTGLKESNDEAKDNLAWGAIVGVDWAFAENWTTGLMYRYINLGEVGTGGFAAGDSVSADDYTSHDILLSVYYRF